MAKYEVMFVTRSGLNDQDKEAILKQATEVITKNEGKINKKEVWMEKHRMAFAIKKQREGTYFLVEFNIPEATVIKLNQAWKLNENMLRFQIIRLGE